MKKKFSPGEIRGHWTILKYGKPGHYLCRCICGKEKEVDVQGLERGRSKSCGCKMVELTKETKAFFSEDEKPRAPRGPAFLSGGILAPWNGGFI